MARREHNLIAQIEQDALDENASLPGALRKCVILGGESGSEQLRDWATRELQGYYGADYLPAYRKVSAQIQIDGATMNGLVKGQPVAPSSLPGFVRENVDEQVELRDGAGAIEALVQRAEATGEPIKLSLPMGGDIARVMNANTRGQHIQSIYWAPAVVTLRGVLDQIRTALTLLVAELRANMPADEDVPSAAAANQAVHLVVTGSRHKINVSTAQAGGASSKTSVAAPKVQDRESPFWTRSRRIGAFAVGAATIIGAIAAVIAISH